MNLLRLGITLTLTALPALAEMMPGTTFTYGGGGFGGASTSSMLGLDQTTTLKTWTGGGHGAHFSDSGTVFVQSGNAGSVSGCFGAAGYGAIKELRWDGTEIRTITAAQMGGGMLHHAFTLTTTGTILAIILENYNGACGERIVEIDPNTSKVIWAWHTNDHLGTGNSAKLVPNASQTRDPFHMNNADLNAATNQIVISSHNTYEIYVIDHSIDSTAAKGAAGDILFRWGKPSTYGATGTDYISGAVHAARWVHPGYPGEGNILLYSNQSPAYGNYAVGFEIKPIKSGTTFTKKASGEFEVEIMFAGKGSSNQFSNTGGMDKLPNGNWLVTYSNSRNSAEFNAGTVEQNVSQAVKTWNLQPQNGIRRYSVCHPGLKKVAETDATVAAITAQCTTDPVIDPVSLKNSKSMIETNYSISGNELKLNSKEPIFSLRIMDIMGKVVYQGAPSATTISISIQGWKNGVYLVQGKSANKTWTRQFTVSR